MIIICKTYLRNEIDAHSYHILLQPLRTLGISFHKVAVYLPVETIPAGKAPNQCRDRCPLDPLGRGLQAWSTYSVDYPISDCPIVPPTCISPIEPGQADYVSPYHH